MESLNYHHLYYFWATARQGSIARAAELLRVSQPTISAQIQALEASLGAKLFSRGGRGLELTDTGRLIGKYADKIFSLGQELRQAVTAGTTARIAIAKSHAITRLFAVRLIEPLLRLPDPPRLLVLDGSQDRLTQDLAAGAIDFALSHERFDPDRIRGLETHRVASSGVSFLAAPSLVDGHPEAGDFPACLGVLPLLLPTDGTFGRARVDAFLEANGLRPRIAAECDDTVLLGGLAQAGVGVLPAPTFVEGQVHTQWGVDVIGRTDEIRIENWAATTRARLENPAVRAAWDRLRASTEA